MNLPLSSTFGGAALGLACTVASAQTELFKMTAQSGGPGDYFGRSAAIGEELFAVGFLFTAPWTVCFYHLETAQLAFELTHPTAIGKSLALDGDVGLVGGGEKALLVDLTTGQVVFTLTSPDGDPAEFFGTSVDLDGGIAVVGAPLNDSLAWNSGAAYLFDVATGALLLELNAPDWGTSHSFGGDVAIDGGRVLVGASGDDDAGINAGAAYLFDAATGQLLHKLIGSDTVDHDSFGQGDLEGDVAVVGADRADPLGHVSGAAYVFDVTTGQQLHKLLPSDGRSGDRFGGSVRIDGGRALVGCHGSDAVAADSGAAYVFDTATGQELFKLTPADGAASDEFGAAVAIRGDLVLVGARRDDDLGDQSGSAYLFHLGPTVGDTYCDPAVPNSTGSPAVITATGSDVAAENALWVTASRLPPQRFGYFLNGPSQGLVANPGGSQGNLCLSGTIGRHTDGVFHTGFAGIGSLKLDILDLPFPGGHTIVAGETWNWSAWYRDVNPTSTSNFTDGVSILFR